MNDKRIIKNIGISMLMKPVSMILSFIYTPLALTFLGKEKYGVWAIILNIISWINYFDIGIGNGLRNKLSESLVTEDKEISQEYVSTAYLGNIIISVIFFVVIILLWNILDLTKFFNMEIENENTDIIIFISIFFICLNFVLSLNRTSAYAIQQPGIISIVGVFGQVFQIMVIFLISHIIQKSLLVIAIMYGVVNLFDNVVLYIIITKKRKYLKPKLKKINMIYMKELLSFGIGFFVIQICSLVLNTTDNLLISNLYGSAEVTTYSTVYKVFNLFVQIHAIIIMPMWSAYTEAAVRKNIEWIKNTMKKINLLTIVFSFGAVIGIFLFEPFAEIWLGQKLFYEKLLIINIAIYMIIQMFANNYSSFLCGVGHIKVSIVISAIGAALNIPLSIFFAIVFNMHLSGIILGSSCVLIFSIVALPITSFKWIKKMEQEWQNQR